MTQRDRPDQKRSERDRTQERWNTRRDRILAALRQGGDSPQELGKRCGMAPEFVSETVHRFPRYFSWDSNGAGKTTFVDLVPALAEARDRQQGVGA